MCVKHTPTPPMLSCSSIIPTMRREGKNTDTSIHAVMRTSAVPDIAWPTCTTSGVVMHLRAFHVLRFAAAHGLATGSAPY